VTCFLATYRPITLNAAGRAAVQESGLPPYIDGSCRREPDLESAFPSVTATCRAGNFAPRLHVDDRVCFITVKGWYAGESDASWRLVAMLRVAYRFASHAEAAAWYAAQGLPLPSNCLVPGNPPKAFELTNRMPPNTVKNRIIGQPNRVRAVRLWNATYRGRVARWPMFLVTIPEYLNITDPPRITRDDFLAVFGKVPSTLTPPEISCDALDHFVTRILGGAAPP